jgi:hypothetical protein
MGAAMLVSSLNSKHIGLNICGTNAPTNQLGNIGSAPLRTCRIVLRWLLLPSVWSRLCLSCSTAERQGAHVGEIMPMYGLNIVCSRESTGDSR